MAIVDVLKRKDGATVLVAILVAMVLNQPLSMIGGQLTSLLLGAEEGGTGGFFYAAPGAGWEVAYAQPIIWALVQLLIIELMIRLYGLLKSSLTKKR